MPDDVNPAPVAAPAGDSPAPTPSTESNPSPPSDAEVTAAIESLGELSASQLAAIESGDFSGLAPDADATKPSDKKPDPKPEPKPEGDKAPEGDKKQDPANIHRIGLGGLPPEARAKLVQFTTLVKGGMSEAEASAQVYGAPAAKTPDTPKEGEKPGSKEPEAPQAPEVPESVKAIEDAITAKKAEIARVRAEYGDTTDLLEQLADLKIDLREAKREHERASATQATFQAQVKQSLDKVMDEHADLWTDVQPGQTKSAFETYCDDEFLLASAKSDPVLQRPDWPEHIAKRVVDKFFKGRGANSAGRDDDDPTIPPLPRQSVRLPGSLTGTTDAPGVLTPGNIEAQFDTLTEEQQLEVLKRAGS